MRTKNWMRHLAWGAFGLVTQQASSQATQPDNLGGAGSFLGWNALANQTLEVKNEANQPIQWFTDNTQRMRLLETLPGQVIGTYNNENLTGNLGVGRFNTMNVTRPFSLLHLDNGGNQFSGYRPWHRPGMTVTTGTDLGWIGLKNEGGDINHFTLAWADNTAVQGPDLLKFIFLANPGTTGTAGSLDGLEAARIRPDANGQESYFGIGDWFTTGGNANPTERLDLLNGKLRIRQLPTDPVSTSTEFVTVNTGTGVLEHRPLTALPDNCEWNMNGTALNHVYTAVGGANASCPDAAEFVGIGTPVPQYKLDVYHTAGSSGSWGGIRSRYNSPSAGSGHGIYSEVNPENGTDLGTASAFYGTVNKMANSGSGLTAGVNVNGSTANLGQVDGVYGSVSVAVGNSPNGYVRGLRGGVSVGNGAQVKYAYGSMGTVLTSSPSTVNATYGMYGDCTHYGSATTSFGGFARSWWFENAVLTTSYGLKAESYPHPSANNMATNSYGLHGSASGGSAGNFSVYGANAGTGSNDWSGYFPGRVLIAGTTYTPSDENLKTNIEPLTNATEQLMLLDPKSYQYLSELYPQMGLPIGTRYGFIAQQVGEHFPGMVTQARQPAEVDSLGQEIHPAVEFMAISTDEMTPLLVAGFQEQQAVIGAQQEQLAQQAAALSAMQDQLAQMQQQLASCCAASGEGRALPAGQNATGTSTPLETDLRIIPNPVADRTELRYTVDTEGRVRLTITGPDGRTIRTQDEGLRAVGTYSYGWDTTALAPGTYHCTLFVNDELVVRKAVKVAGR